MAILRNLRNIEAADVSQKHLNKLRACFNDESWATSRVLPFRFIAAARHAVNLEPELEQAMFKCIADMEKIPGKTVLLVDVSASMEGPISGKSDLNCMDAACGLAMLVREICSKSDIYSFSNQLVCVPNRRGFALRDAIVNSQPHGGTEAGGAVKTLHMNHVVYDRIIMITDEQSMDRLPDPKGKGYVINVASYKHGIGYYSWMHIDGMSEAVLDFIQEYEKEYNEK
jgi:hypothetical protein